MTTLDEHAVKYITAESDFYRRAPNLKEVVDSLAGTDIDLDPSQVFAELGIDNPYKNVTKTK